MLSRPYPEPDCDVSAQVKALCDPNHIKDAVYLSPHNTPPELGAPVLTIKRDEGSLLTTNPAKAVWFAQAVLSDDDLADLLGLPEKKSAFNQNSIATVIQARDADGAVITESIASQDRFGASVEVLARHVPPGGSLAFLSLPDAIRRRMSMRRENGHV